MNQFPHRSPPLHWLTVLRYPAALWVILIHALHNFGNPDVVPDSLRKSFMERGYLGVPFFFILSGFILTYNYPVIASKKSYLSARAGRILPNYYLSLIFSLPLVLSKTALGGGLLFAFPRILAFLTLTQAWIPGLSRFWNYPAWTLSCEAFFYTSLIFILAPLQKLISQSPKKSLLVLAACFLFGLVAPFLFVIHYGYVPDRLLREDSTPAALLSAKNFIEVFPLFHLAEFAAGVALCLGMRAKLGSLAPYSGWLLMLGLVQVLTSLFIPAIFSLGTYCLPGFALIILGAAALPFPDLKSSGKWVQSGASFAILLGNASYAVYLFHLPILIYLLHLNGHLLKIFPSGEAGVWTLFMATAITTTFLSILIFHYYEEPARRWVTQALKQPGLPFKLGEKNRPSPAETA